jgi:hypothetical protein
MIIKLRINFMLPLALLVFLLIANNVEHASAAHYFAVPADLFN